VTSPLLSISTTIDIDGDRYLTAYIDGCQYVCGMKTLPLIDCCSPLLSAPMRQKDAERMATAFRVLADPARLRLLNLIAAHPDGEACVCDLIDPLGLAQPTVSHHLKVLNEAGLLEREKRGTWVYYRAVPDALDSLREALGASSEVPKRPTGGRVSIRRRQATAR
jgi:ArsR family transcriptional regulator